MKIILNLLWRCSFFIIIVFVFSHFRTVQSRKNELEKLVLTAEMIVNETAIGDATMLVDEQDISQDPLKGKNGKPKKGWFPGWVKSDYLPISAVIDLGSEHFVSDLFLYDEKGKGCLKVYTGKPFKWEEEFVDSLTNYNKWNQHSLNKKTQFIKIESHSSTLPLEVVLYGKTAAKAPMTKASKQNRSYPLMESFIGINGFIDDPLNNIRVGGHLREYHNWRWDEGPKEASYPNNQNKWCPSYAGNWDFDRFYLELKKLNILVIPCIQGGLDWINKNLNAKPIVNNKNPEDPFAYAAHADHMFQFAARYGSTVHSKEDLKLANDQKVVSGLNLVKYVENWNEQDKQWEGRESYFSPYEFAAMSSADFDGHLGKMGKKIGVKNADPAMKMVMGGLATLNINYIKAIKFWSDHNRNGSVPFDVINVHHYCNSSKQSKDDIHGISPEEGKLKELLLELVEYRNQNLPDKEIWITEFGYDTNPKSPQRAPQIGEYTHEEVQAQWVVRSYLAIAASGVDKASLYMLRDANSEGKNKYATSGLTSDKASGKKPKASWFYIKTLKSRLNGMRFVEENSLDSDKIRVTKFKNFNDQSGAFVVWCPTSNGSTINNFTLKLEGGARATLVKLSKFKPDGLSFPLSVKDDSVRLEEVSETPVIVMVDRVK